MKTFAGCIYFLMITCCCGRSHAVDPVLPAIEAVFIECSLDPSDVEAIGESTSCLTYMLDERSMIFLLANCQTRISFDGIEIRVTNLISEERHIARVDFGKVVSGHKLLHMKVDGLFYTRFYEYFNGSDELTSTKHVDQLFQYELDRSGGSYRKAGVVVVIKLQNLKVYK